MRGWRRAVAAGIWPLLRVDCFEGECRLTRLQKSTYTRANRYPEVFAEVSRRLGGKGRVLSFGCSSGVEVISLAELYFDHSTIIGVDIEASKLLLARKRAQTANLRNNLVDFRLRETFGWLRGVKKFDAIFAMSVLCSFQDGEPGPPLPYDLYLSAVRALVAALKPGGYIVLYNANYRIEDTPLRHKLQRVRVRGADLPHVPVYYPNGREAPQPKRFVYRKRLPRQTPKIIKRLLGR